MNPVEYDRGEASYHHNTSRDHFSGTVTVQEAYQLLDLGLKRAQQIDSQVGYTVLNGVFNAG
ncbi:hypothetical protein D3C73_1673660 [compost metagenome]